MMASFFYVLARRRVNKLSDIEIVRKDWQKESQVVGIIAGVVLATFFSLRDSFTDLPELIMDVGIMGALVATVNSILILFHAQQVRTTEFLVFMKRNYSPPVVFVLPHYYAVVSFLLMLIAWWLQLLMDTLDWHLSSLVLPFRILRLVGIALTMVVIIASLYIRDRARLLSLNLEEDGLFGLENLSNFQIRSKLGQLNRTKYTHAELKQFMQSITNEHLYAPIIDQSD